MKIFLLVGCLLVLLGLVSVGPREPVQSVERRSGVLTGWQLDMNGSVYLRLSHRAPTDETDGGLGAAVDIWFVTPPQKAPNFDVEHMVLDVAFRAQAELPLTITTKTERSLDGKTPEEALPILSISSP